MNTVEFLVNLEASHMLGLDDLNYDSVWGHQEEVVEEELAKEDEPCIFQLEYLDP